ncbi:MAG: hypothetical protein IT293_03700 [Deltaproteobacteria bacterium]|nr:hypothetical protein [Deltaproteobacteria bacterium]
MGVRIHLQYATPQMRLARPISDANGRLVAGVGTLLSLGVVRVLRQMAVQSVMVDDAGERAPWEQVRTLDEEREALAARFSTAPPTPALLEIRTAIARHLERRAAAFVGAAAATEGRES